MTSIERFSNYVIFENGDVISLKRGITLKSYTKDGYKIFKLINDQGIQKNMYLHRLVALAYIPNPLNKPCNDHIDQKKSNNHSSNLRWATHTENSQNIKQPRSDSKLNEKYIGIFINKSGTKFYKFEKTINKKRHVKHFKTLEEAKKYRDEFISNLSNSGK